MGNSLFLADKARIEGTAGKGRRKPDGSLKQPYSKIDQQPAGNKKKKILKNIPGRGGERVKQTRLYQTPVERLPDWG